MYVEDLFKKHWEMGVPDVTVTVPPGYMKD